MRDDARQAGIVEGRGRPSERPVLTISGSGEGGRKRGGTAGLLEDVPNRLVPIGELEISRGGFEEEVRDGDEDSDQELESLASQVAERILDEEDEDNQQVVGLSRY